MILLLSSSAKLKLLSGSRGDHPRCLCCREGSRKALQPSLGLDLPPQWDEARLCVPGLQGVWKSGSLGHSSPQTVPVLSGLQSTGQNKLSTHHLVLPGAGVLRGATILAAPAEGRG